MRAEQQRQRKGEREKSQECGSRRGNARRSKERAKKSRARGDVPLESRTCEVTLIVNGN